MKYLLVVAVVLCTSIAFAQGVYVQTVQGLPPYIAAPLDDAGSGYYVGPVNPVLCAFPSNIRERRIPLSRADVNLLACRYVPLISRFGRPGQAVMCLNGQPACLPVGCSGWFTWGKDARIQVSWSTVTPEQSAAMPGWLIDLGDNWFVHLQVGVGCQRYGQNVIAFYGKWDTTWCPPELVEPMMPAPVVPLEVHPVPVFTECPMPRCGVVTPCQRPQPKSYLREAKLPHTNRWTVKRGSVGIFGVAEDTFLCEPEYPDYTPTLLPH